MTPEKISQIRSEAKKEYDRGIFLFGYIPFFLNLCLCGCNEIVYGNHKYIKGHQTKGKTLSDNQIEIVKLNLKMGQGWNKGLTKENCKSLEIQGTKHSSKMKGKPSWNKGLTKETDERVRKLSNLRFGNTRSIKTKKLMSSRAKEGYKLGTRTVPKNAGYSKHGIRLDLGHYVRSSWEANICRILKHQGTEYQYESKRFDIGDCTYLPDIFIPSENIWIEIKGYWKEKDKIKFEKFLRLYPNENIIVIESEGYKNLINIFKNNISNLE